MLKRSFIIGEEWLYYKIYTGYKTADAILTDIVKPLCEKLIDLQIIDKWFFIRYGDPKNHLRLRFHISDEKKMSEVLYQFKEAIEPYIENNLVWKIQADTYQREVERYGINTMELGETLFFHDSRMIVDMLDMIEGDEGEKIRWMFSLRAMDQLLNDFNYNIEEKFNLLDRLRFGFGQEFNMNKQLSKQIHGKYRNNSKEIQLILDRNKDEESELKPLFQLLDNKSLAIKPIVNEILELHSQNKLQLPLNDLMGSYLHMLCNRLFRSKQRIHELVVYNFLSAYYRQQIMMEKSKQKEKITV